LSPEQCPHEPRIGNDGRFFPRKPAYFLAFLCPRGWHLEVVGKQEVAQVEVGMAPRPRVNIEMKEHRAALGVAHMETCFFLRLA
jgi:hypothetical protein